MLTSSVKTYDDVKCNGKDKYIVKFTILQYCNMVIYNSNMNVKR